MNSPSKPNFAPGPWTLVPSKDMETGDMYGVFEVHSPTRYPLFDIEVCDSQTEATARLVVAAPEMLEALAQSLKPMELAHNGSEGCPSLPIEDCDCLIAEAYAAAIAAIAKAEVRA